MTRAVYPGTFDPITLGHEDLVRRAAKLFDELVVAVANSKSKHPFLSIEDRIDLAKEVLADCKNVKVVGFSGLLTDFLKQEDATIIVRGLRAVSDFEYEFQMAGTNRKLLPGIETLFLTPSDQYMFISATMVREIFSFGGDVSQFVNPITEKRLTQILAKKK